MNLYQQYRPGSFDEVIGQDAAVSRLKLLGRSGYGGKAIWLTGPSGVGKTTLAMIVAGINADPENISEYDAAAITGATIREIGYDMHYVGLGLRPGKSIVINEAHALRKDVIRSLLIVLEAIPSHVVFVFTTTKTGQQGLLEDYDDAEPLLSRCFKITLTNQGLCKPFAARLKAVAEELGLGKKPLSQYEKLVTENHNNMRAAWQAIEAGEMLYEEDRMAL